MTAQRYNGPARDGDWVNYRDIITALYLDQNKSLKEVMRIMREEYYFFATEKMYKIRFNKWGLHKKLRAHQVAELLVQHSRRAAVGKASVSYVHGRKVDVDRLNTYLRRVSPARRKELEAIRSGEVQLASDQRRRLGVIICRTPSPEPESMLRRLDAPDSLRLPEECLQIVRDYVRGAFEASLWHTTPQQELIFPRMGKTWLDPVSCARQLLISGLSAQGFSMLNIALNDYRAVLAKEDPSLLIETCLALGALLQSGLEIAKSLVNFAWQLSMIVFELPRHPLRLLFSRLRTAPLTEIRQVIGLILQAYLQAMQVGSRLKPTYLATVYRAMLNSEFIDTATTQHLLRGILAGLEAVSPPPPPDPASPPDPPLLVELRKDTNLVRYHLAWLFDVHDKPNEARAAARTLAETRGHDARLARFSAYNMLRTLPTSHEVGDDEVIALLYGALAECEAQWGPVDNAAVSVLAVLEQYLVRAGNVGEAARVRADFDARWQEVCRRLRESKA
ncbi:Clr5 domain-containing protein [Durotheca rogersii]|uniref:Clr5 domain-containing protein n=1 Tax=Durotheca rogersii TaxID=419775 RepID=UPI00221ECB7C|nr:Clr5 domain-containing protein [Durotheca rogersii]KAI5861812.1 Clr5 domain-containing protein [Durotheca rogersii]